MVWGGIHLNGRTPLYVIQTFLTGLRSRDEIVCRLIEPRDQAPLCRTTAPLLTEVGSSQTSCNSKGSPRMDWPARCPDLVPVKHVWDVLGCG